MIERVKEIYGLLVRYTCSILCLFPCVSVCLSPSLSLFVNYRHIRVNFNPSFYSEGQASHQLPTVTMTDIFVAFISLSTQVFCHCLKV